MTTCVIIPAFNERKLPLLIEKLLKLGKTELIIVDDGSVASANFNGIMVIRHEKNLGKGAAIRTGIKYAQSKGYKSILLMDADLQHDPIDALRLLETPCGTVFGVRYFNEKMPFVRKLTNVASSLFCSMVTRKRIPDVHCGLRKIDTESLDGIKINGNRFDGELELVLKLTKKLQKMTYVPIKTIYTDKKTTINPILDTIRFFKTLFFYGF